MSDYRCCDTLNGLTAEPRIAGHHALCPRFGLAAIEKWHEAGQAIVEGGASQGYEIMHAQRGVLLTALRERDAEVKRLRGGLAELTKEWERGASPVELYRAHVRELRALLSPAGTLASIPPDECDGALRPGEK